MHGQGSNAGAPGASPGRAEIHDDLDNAVMMLTAPLVQQKKGFVLGLAEDMKEGGAKSLEVTVRPALQPADTFEAPPSWRHHTVQDADSLVAMAQRYGKEDESLVLYDDEGVQLVLNEQPAKGAREFVRLEWQKHDDLQAWEGLLNKTITHKDLIKALVPLAHTMVDTSILVALRTLRATHTIEVESDLREDDKSVGVCFKTAAGPELRKFPRTWKVSTPILDADEELKTFEVRLEVVLPDRGDQPIAFILTSPDMRPLIRGRIDTEIEEVRTELGGKWLIARGRHGERARVIGHPSNPTAKGC